MRYRWFHGLPIRRAGSSYSLISIPDVPLQLAGLRIPDSLSRYFRPSQPTNAMIAAD